jgi:hypothetical protein
MNSNAAMKLMLAEPQLDLEGTWELRSRTGAHVLSPRSRLLLVIGDDETHLHLAPPRRAADPVPRWLAASGRAFFEGMCAMRVPGTLHDVTEQKRTEQDRNFRSSDHLGLDIVSEIVRKQGGRVELSSDEHPTVFHTEWRSRSLRPAAEKKPSRATSHIREESSRGLCTEMSLHREAILDKGVAVA